MYFRIERESPDRLTLTAYDFRVSAVSGDQVVTMTLGNVVIYKRDTKRHKFALHSQWKNGWEPRSQRLYNQTDEFPGCPDDVRIEAKEVLSSRTVYQFDPS